MAAKPVQISLDERLLRKIDRDPETRRRGRSAFIRSAVDLYFKATERQAMDEQLRRAYEGRSDELLAEIETLTRKQAWPDE